MVTNMLDKDKRFWNGFAKFYDLVIKKDEAFYQKIVKHICKELDISDVVCEVAAGTGNISLQLSKNVSHIELSDFAKEMVEIAESKIKEQNLTNIHCSVQDVCNLNFQPNSFDAVIISNALHIMPHPEDALISIKKALKSNGLIIAPTFVVGDNKLAKIASTLMKISGYKAYHKWNCEQLTDFIKSNGFTIEKSKLYKGILPLLYISARKTM